MQIFKKIFFIFLYCFFIISTNQAQVNLQTGSATVNLPIFNWQDSKSRLNTSISLNYNSSNGLRVSDVASNVGQGWNLMAEGVITRMQVGEPDDQFPQDIGETKYPAGYLHPNRNKLPEDGCPTALTRYPIYGEQNRLYKQHNALAEDRELDYFSFQFNGKSGLFILDKETGKGVSLEDNKMEISFNLSSSFMIYNGYKIRTRISSFTIKDENGFIYRFNKIGLTKILKPEYCDAGLTYKLQPKLEDDGVYNETLFDNGVPDPYIINSWYLTEVEDVLTHRKILYNYGIRAVDAFAGRDLAIYQKPNVSPFTGLFWSSYAVISHKRSITVTPEISNIVFPDGHLVYFNHQTEDRIDLKGEHALSSIDIKYKTLDVTKYTFNTSYFILKRIGKPISDFEKKAARLCLVSLKKAGPGLKDEDIPYIFDYYKGSTTTSDDVIPPPFSPIKDIWGYYNGDNSKAFDPNFGISLYSSLSSMNINELKGLAFLRNNSNDIELNPKSGYARNGLLRQIIYPTGGTLTYEYVQNEGLLVGQQRVVGGVHVSKTKVSDGGFSNDCNNPIETNYNYVSENNESSLWGLEMPQNMMLMESHYKPEYKYWSYSFPIGKCGYKYKFPGILSIEEAFSLTDGQKLLVALSSILDVVGTVMGVINVIQVIAMTTGAPWVSFALNMISGLLDIVLTCIVSQEKDFLTKVYYNADLNASNPLPVQYKRVEVIPKTGDIGKTIYEFTNDADYPIWELTNPIHSMQQRYGTWAYGLPKKVLIQNASGQPIKETITNYYFFSSKEPKITYKYYWSCKCQLNKTTSQRNVDWEDPSKYLGNMTKSSAGDIAAYIYKMYLGHAELNAVTEKVFDNIDPTKFSTSKTEYYRDDNNLPYYLNNNMVITKSDGTIEKITQSYSAQYSNSNQVNLSALASQNILTMPVSKKSFIKAPESSTEYLLSSTYTDYRITSNGDYKPEYVFDLPLNKPHLNNSSNNPNYIQKAFFMYNTEGDIIGQMDEGLHKVSYLYDYGVPKSVDANLNRDKKVVATLVNANPLERSAYSSFESEETSIGGWDLTGTAVFRKDLAVTGNVSLQLQSGNSLSATISGILNNPTQAYRLSFWSTANLSLPSYANLVKSSPVINGFTYYEYNINAGTSVVTIQGNAIIDEVRLYPATARMTTTTSDPLLGKTSECDENNRITYYEYDGLGRMKLIKDENRHIVKMYEYGKAKQKGCPGNYSNAAIDAYFTKNDCQPGYMGTEVHYPTIPAGKYTSDESQEEVDAQVEAELGTLGQAYANTHGQCIKIWKNGPQSQNFITQGCSNGQIGGTVTYTVPADRYTSLIDQQHADQFALDEIIANGQGYANAPANRVCISTTNPIWEAQDGDPTFCIAGFLWVQMTNINPNSPTYKSTTLIRTEQTCTTSTGGGGVKGCQILQLRTSSYYSLIGSSIKTRNTDTIDFNLIIQLNENALETLAWRSGVNLADVPHKCIEEANDNVPDTNPRTIPLWENGRFWNIIIAPDRSFTVKLIDGILPTNLQSIEWAGWYKLSE